MMLRNKPICKLYAFGLALLFTVALAGCGGGGGTKKAMDTDTGTPPATGLTPAEQCAADGGRFEDDDSCTSACRWRKAEADTKSAGTKEEAIGAEAVQMDDAGHRRHCLNQAIHHKFDGNQPRCRRHRGKSPTPQMRMRTRTRNSAPVRGWQAAA